MSTEQWRNPEFLHPALPPRADPEIDALIAGYVEEYGLSIFNGEKAEYKAAEEGDQIDKACLGWTRRGNEQDWLKSAQLRALRYVRKLSRPVYTDEPPIDFSVPILDLEQDKKNTDIYHDPYYWTNVDKFVMAGLELQAKNQGGDYFGYPDASELQSGRNDYQVVSTLRNHSILKSTVVAWDRPVHVFYRAEKVF